MENITFLNNNAEGTLETIGRDALSQEIETLTEYMNNYETYESGSDDLPPWFEYGLGFDYVDPKQDEESGWFDFKTDYFRFQISWGGPSDEIRFYEDGRIEYVYMDWFCGVGFDVKHLDCFEWVKQNFEDCEMMNFEEKRQYL